MSGTPLLPIIAGIIRDEGPIGLDRFMALAMGHPRHGYYVTRDPFGAAGDFTTAPEISQMFGEMIGLWCASLFESLGSPERLALVELGPGRGTLMADLLRAARVVPAFGAALEVHLVETSPVLRARQAETLRASGHVPRWHASLDTVPKGPMLLVANEFFDALPVRHYQKSARGWHERLVGLAPDDAGQDGLAFGLAAEPEPSLTLAAPEGAMLEVAAAAQGMMTAIAARIAGEGGAALVVDYGYAPSRFGESLQAMAAHAFVDPLADPGEADLTTHVDFAALARAATAAGAAVHGPITQAAFLGELGIGARAAALARARPDRAAAIGHDLDRLVGERPGMGRLFKVMAVTAAGAPAPPGFPP